MKNNQIQPRLNPDNLIDRVRMWRDGISRTEELDKISEDAYKNAEFNI